MDARISHETYRIESDNDGELISNNIPPNTRIIIVDYNTNGSAKYVSFCGPGGGDTSRKEYSQQEMDGVVGLLKKLAAK